MSLQGFLSSLIEETECNINTKDIEYKQKLGSGNFGEVYKAYWRKTPIAIKILTSNLRNKQEFKSECKIIHKLSHPNIVQFYGIVNDANIGIGIELLVENLEPYNAHNTKREQALNFILDITRGIYYLHDRKPNCIIHRDIKPTNLLLTESKRVKICDFGISCFQHDPKQKYKMTGETGTYRYMAPEVLLCEEYDSSVDIYSLGIIMFKLLEDIPFKFLTVTQIINAVSKKSYYPKIKDYAIKDLIENTWNYDPEKRITADEVIDQLEYILSRKEKHKKFIFF